MKIIKKAFYSLLIVFSFNIVFVENTWSAHLPPEDPPSCEFCRRHPGSNFCSGVCESKPAPPPGRYGDANWPILDCSVTEIAERNSNTRTIRPSDRVQINTGFKAIKEFQFASGARFTFASPLLRQSPDANSGTIYYKSTYQTLPGVINYTSLQLRSSGYGMVTGKLQKGSKNGNELSMQDTSSLALGCRVK